MIGVGVNYLGGKAWYEAIDLQNIKLQKKNTCFVSSLKIVNQETPV